MRRSTALATCSPRLTPMVPRRRRPPGVNSRDRQQRAQCLKAARRTFPSAVTETLDLLSCAMRARRCFAPRRFLLSSLRSTVPPCPYTLRRCCALRFSTRGPRPLAGSATREQREGAANIAAAGQLSQNEGGERASDLPRQSTSRKEALQEPRQLVPLLVLPHRRTPRGSGSVPRTFLSSSSTLPDASFALRLVSSRHDSGRIDGRIRALRIPPPSRVPTLCYALLRSLDRALAFFLNHGLYANLLGPQHAALAWLLQFCGSPRTLAAGDAGLAASHASSAHDAQSGPAGSMVCTRAFDSRPARRRPAGVCARLAPSPRCVP